MSQAPAERPADAQPEDALEELSALGGIEDVPLPEQVEVFQSIHDRLSARLSSAEG